MKSTSTLVSIALAAALAVGAAYFFGDGETRESPATANTSLPPDSPTPASTTTHEPRDSVERHRQIALEIERALVSADPRQRETAFNELLPELIREEPERASAMVAKQEPGETRDLLRDEVTRQWIRSDPEAAVAWLGSLPEDERKAGATTAVRTLAASSPAQAIEVADRFGLGRDDGSLEHLVQIWATENPDEAARWIDSQPPNDPRTVQLRARIEQVRAQGR